MYDDDPLYAAFLRDKLKGQKPESPALGVIYCSTKAEVDAYMEELE